MALNVSQIGQIAPPVLDVHRAEAFYEQVLGRREPYRFGDLTLFDCPGVGLPLERQVLKGISAGLRRCPRHCGLPFPNWQAKAHS